MTVVGGRAVGVGLSPSDTDVSVLAARAEVLLDLPSRVAHLLTITESLLAALEPLTRPVRS